MSSIVSRTAPSPPARRGDKRDGSRDFGRGVRHRDAEARPTNHRQVRQVVADITRLLRSQP